MKKKIVFTAFVAAIMMSCSVYAENISVYLNDAPISFGSAKPSIVNGRTLVPLRSVFDAMGYSVDWDAAEKIAYLEKGSSTVSASTAGMTLYTPKNTSDIECDVLPQIIDGSFMIPLRAVSEASGAKVDWDADKKIVKITLEKEVNDKTDDETDSEDKNDQKSVNFEGTMEVEEKEYIETLKASTDAIFKFAVDHDDKVLKSLLLGYDLEIDGIVTASADFYTPVQEEIDKLKMLEPPSVMSEVQECVFEYLDVLQKAINEITQGSYNFEEIERDRRKLSENSENYAIRLSRYFKENSVEYERLYGSQVLDALKRN